MEKSGTGDVNREGVWLWIEDQQRWDRKRCGRRCLYKGLLKPLSVDMGVYWGSGEGIRGVGGGRCEFWGIWGESMCLEGDRTQCL